MALFDVRTVTIAISTQVSSPFAFAGEAVIGAWLPAVNGTVFLQAGLLRYLNFYYKLRK